MGRRATTGLSAVAVALVMAVGAGCGGDGGTTGDPVAGARIVQDVAEPSCGRCHALAEADFTGRTAPNLDAMRPGYDRVLDAIRTGPGLMPSFDDRLSDDQMHDVAAYISQAAAR